MSKVEIFKMKIKIVFRMNFLIISNNLNKISNKEVKINNKNIETL